MQRLKSKRHVKAANMRWRAAEARAAAERDAGIPDRPIVEDTRKSFPLDLGAAGFHDLLIEPRLGYVAWRAVRKDTGQPVHSAALKQLLHWAADQVPRALALRNFR